MNGAVTSGAHYPRFGREAKRAWRAFTLSQRVKLVFFAP
jgi:hypothetical protein